MHVPPAIPTSLLYGFLLVLARISGVFVYLPLPGLQAGPSAPKILLSMILTFGMFSRWPVLDPAPTSMVQIAGWMLAEAAIGLATGLAVGIIIEAILFAAQAISTQAGFAYASTIDPNTEADSTVLLILAQLTAGLLFFAMGFDRVLLAVLSRSLETHPPGAFIASRASVEALVMLGSNIFSTGLHLALPLMTLLFLIDLSIGLLGHLNSQLQLISLAFPAKMVAALAALSLLVLLIPKLYQQLGAASFNALGRLLGL
ncbi:MAG TPA: flagellar biosynthetic protein FliR [Bryobacteraceae bacterium]|nr:flagellar biosynthetic protein FliR [Bryobacteraceae bacterium]